MTSLVTSQHTHISPRKALTVVWGVIVVTSRLTASKAPSDSGSVARLGHLTLSPVRSPRLQGGLQFSFRAQPWLVESSSRSAEETARAVCLQHKPSSGSSRTAGSERINCALTLGQRAAGAARGRQS